MQEKPKDCSNCAKPITILYKELSQKGMKACGMCSDCPLLNQYLHGEDLSSCKTEEASHKGLCCSHCHTSLGDYMSKGQLGCDQCYEVFEKLIMENLDNASHLPPSLSNQKGKKLSSSLHVGHTPKKPMIVAHSQTIRELYDALKVALDGENYEHAAKIRDQIKMLREKTQ